METVLLSGTVPQGGIPAAFYDSSKCYSIFDDDGELLAMCGVLPDTLEPGTGRAWFLATPAIEGHSLSLLKKSPQYLDQMADPYPNGLRALLWEGNPMHLRWASSVGFEVTGFTYRHTNLFLEIRRP